MGMMTGFRGGGKRGFSKVGKEGIGEVKGGWSTLSGTSKTGIKCVQGSELQAGRDLM